MEKLVPANEQRRRPCAVKHRPYALCNLLDPVFRRALSSDPHVEVLRRDEHPIGSLEPTLLHSVHPDNEGVSLSVEGAARDWRWADEIGDREAARLDDLVAQLPHPSRLLNAIGARESQILVDLAPDLVGIERTASSRAASRVAKVVLPAPGNPIMSILRDMFSPTLSRWLAMARTVLTKRAQ
jgi:hypothetical protein